MNSKTQNFALVPQREQAVSVHPNNVKSERTVLQRDPLIRGFSTDTGNSMVSSVMTEKSLASLISLSNVMRPPQISKVISTTKHQALVPQREQAVSVHPETGRSVRIVHISDARSSMASTVTAERSLASRASLSNVARPPQFSKVISTTKHQALVPQREQAVSVHPETVRTLSVPVSSYGDQVIESSAIYFAFCDMRDVEHESNGFKYKSRTGRIRTLCTDPKCNEEKHVPCISRGYVPMTGKTLLLMLQKSMTLNQARISFGTTYLRVPLGAPISYPLVRKRAREEEEAAKALVQLSNKKVREDVPEAQGKTDRMTRKVHQIKGTGKFMEFGYQLDMTDAKDVQKYIELLDEWLNRVKLPSDSLKARDFVICWNTHNHRKIGLEVLQSSGNKTAKLFLSLLAKPMKQERYEAWDRSEAQMLTGLAELVWAFLGMYLMYRIYQIPTSDVKSLVKDGVASGVASSTGNVFQAVWNKVQQYFYSTRDTLWEALSAVKDTVMTTLKTIVTGIASIIAFEYVHTAFPEFYFQCKAALCSMLGVEGPSMAYESAAQGTDNIIKDIISFVSGFFPKSQIPIGSYLDKLPKVVSIAKALEYIFTNFGKIYGYFVEWWTGCPHPKAQLEYDVVAFNSAVTMLEEELSGGDAKSLFSLEVKNQVQLMILTKERIERAQVVVKDYRPIFGTMFMAASLRFSKIKNKYDAQMRMAEERPVPVWLYVHGKRGVGKSHDLKALQQYIWTYLQKHCPETELEGPFHMGHSYSYVQTEDFFDGYKNQFFTIIDDLFQSTEKEVRAQTANNLIQLISPSLCSLRVATIEDKANTYFNSRVIISTSNLPVADFGSANLGLTDVMALRDRITLNLVKQEDGYYLDPSIKVKVEDKLRVGPFKVEEVAAIASECVIAQLKRMSQPVPPIDQPRISLSFKGARLSFEPDSKDKVEAQGKDKEKEKVEEEDRGSALETETEREVRIRKRAGKEKTQPWSTGELECFGVRDSWTEWFIKKQISVSTLLQDPKRWMKDSLTQYGEFFDKDEEIKMFRRIFKFEQLYNFLYTHPQYLPEINRFTNWHEWKYFWTNAERPLMESRMSTVSFKLWKKTLLTPNGTSPSLLDLNWSKVFIEAQVLDESRMSYGAEYLVTTSATVIRFAVVAVLAWKVMRALLPATAHAQAAYETGVPKKTKPVVIRAKMKQKPINPQGIDTDVHRVVARNCDIIETRMAPKGLTWEVVRHYDPVATSHCLFVYSDYVLIPGHVLNPPVEDDMELWHSLNASGETVLRSDQIKFRETVASDLELVRFEGAAERRNILNFFAQQAPTAGRIGQLLPDFTTSGSSYIDSISWENKVSEIFVSDKYGSFEVDLKLYGVPNKKGMCGLPYIHRSSGKIVGIHMAGTPSSSTAYAVMMLKPDLEKWDPRLILEDPLDLEEEEAQGIAGVRVIGKLPKKMAAFMPMKSKLIESQFDVSTFPFPETDSLPAPLRPVERIRAGEKVKIAPLDVALSKFTKTYRVVPDHEPSCLTDCLPKTFEPRNVRIVTLEEAVYGIPGYMKSIDMGTSPGYFWKKLGYTRRDLFYEGEKPRIHPLFRRSVEQLIEKIQAGIIVPDVFEETLKDEIRSADKVEAVDTRLYSVAGLTSLVVQKMYLGTFYVEFTKDPVGSAIGLGINPHSSEWRDLYGRLRGAVNEERIIAGGDFSGYDMSLINRIKVAFHKLVSIFLPGHSVEIWIVLEMNFQGWHVLGILVFIRENGTSSGSFITSMFNTFANWYIHKTAFVSLYPEDEWKTVECTFTGDDSLFTVDKDHRKFDMAYMERFCRDNFGMIYTSPTKTDVMSLSWEDAQYLKRRFVKGHMGIMAPLSQKSIANMVKWTDNYGDYEVMNSVVNSVLLEAFHYGKGVYQECERWIEIEQKRIGHVYHYPSWEGMVKMRSQDY